jgi:hypothetical protein
VTDGGEVSSAPIARIAPTKLPTKSRTVRNVLATCIAVSRRCLVGLTAAQHLFTPLLSLWLHDRRYATRILTNRQIWMRSMTAMNDYMKVEHAGECLTAAYNTDPGKIKKSLIAPSMLVFLVLQRNSEMSSTLGRNLFRKLLRR